MSNSLASTGCSEARASELLDDRALARDRNRGVDQHALKRVVAGDEPGELAEVFLRLLEVEPLGEDRVEQGASIAGGGTSIGHRTRPSSIGDPRCRAARRSGTAGCWVIGNENI